MLAFDLQPFSNILDVLCIKLRNNNLNSIAYSFSYTRILLVLFNYTSLFSLQTLLKTTNHILIHDVRGSMAHLRSLVQRGVSPHSHLCVICSRDAESLADGTKDDVIVFR